MDGLIQVQPIADASGILKGMVGLDKQGRIWYGELKPLAGHAHPIQWHRMPDSVE